MIRRPVRGRAHGSDLAQVAANDSDRPKDRDGVTVRVIRSTRDDPPRVGPGAEHVLITHRLDAVAQPATGLILLDPERGEEELTFDAPKTHQDPRRATKRRRCGARRPPV